MSEAETIIYLVDIQIPGIEEKTEQVTKLKSALDELPKAHDAEAKSSHEAGEAEKAHGEILKASSEATKEWSSALQEMAGTRMPAFTGAIAQAGTELAGMLTKTVALEAGIAAISLAMVAATAQTTVLGAEWQHTVTDIATAADITIEKAYEIGTAFQGIAGSEIPQTAKEIAEAYTEVAGRLNLYHGEALDAAQATEIMKVAGEGAIATGQSLSSATNALTKEIMASHVPIEEASHVMDVLVNTSIATGMGFEQLTMIAGRLQARMGQAAPDIAGVGFALAVVTEAGISGQRAMLPVMTLLQELANPSEKAQQDLNALGVEISKNADGSLNLVESFASLKTAYQGLTTDAERHAFAEDLVGKNAGTLEAMLKLTNAQFAHAEEVINASNSAHEKAEMHSQDLKERTEKLTAQTQSLAAAMGNELAKALVDDANGFSALGTIINRVQGDMQRYQDTRLRERFVAGGGQLPEGTTGMTGIPSRDDWAQTSGPAGESNWAGAEQAAARAQAYQLDLAGIRAEQDALTAMGSAGERANKIMADYYKLPADLGPAGKKAIEELTAATNAQAAAIEKANGPDAQTQIATLKRLTDEYAAAVASKSNEQIQAAQNALTSYETELNTTALALDRAHKEEADAKKAAAEAKRVADEAKRAAEEAARATTATGLATAMAKGLEGADLTADLDPAAAKVMQDFNAALASQGTQQASAAGKTLGDALVGLADQMRKGGVGDWQESLSEGFNIAGAIARGEPGAQSAFHGLLAHMSEEIDQAAIGAKWERDMQTARDADAKAWDTYEASIANATRTAANARAAAEQQESQRILENDERLAVERQLQIEKNDAEEGRIRDKWAQEDIDRADKTAREIADTNERNQRSMNDMVTKNQESIAGTARAHRRQDADEEYQHQERITEIKRKGGPGMGQALADEDRTFKQAQDDRARSRAEDAAEAAAKFQEQQADAQRRISEQNADAVRRRAEQEQDVQKSRENQMAARNQAITDQAAVAAEKLRLEKQFGIDAETLAKQRHTAELARISETEQHAKDEAQRHLDETEGSLISKLNNDFASIQQAYPWLMSVGVTPPGTAGELRGAGTTGAATTRPGSSSFGGFFPTAGVPGFDEGGDFTVQGSGGPDSQMIRVSPGEHVSITPRSSGEPVAGGGPNLYSQLMAQQSRESALSGAGRTTAGATGGGNGASPGGGNNYFTFTFPNATITSEQEERKLVQMVLTEAVKVLRGPVIAGGKGP